MTERIESHSLDVVVEDARFLLDQGEHFDRVARRLGYTPNSLEKLMGRKSGKGDPASTEATRQSA